VWAFDTTYTAPVDDWTAWLAAKPALEIDVFYRRVGGTKAGGIAFERAVSRGGGRLRVTRAAEGHCAVPGRGYPRCWRDRRVDHPRSRTTERGRAFHGDEEEPFGTRVARRRRVRG
jgi:hypothetical protein